MVGVNIRRTLVGPASHMKKCPPHNHGPTVLPDAKVNPRVFISYSRKDLEFVKRLSADLNATGCLCDFDVADTDPNNVGVGIAAEDEWWKRLQEMISRAQVVVFVVSPHSARSKVCDEEVAFAMGNAKRVIAVTYGPVNLSALPPHLLTLNVAIHFGVGAEPGYTQAVAKVAGVVQLDVRWHRAAADVVVAARKWDALGRGNEAVVHGSELQAVQEWAARRPSSAPPHSELVVAYLNACQKSAAERMATLDAERVRYLELMEVATPMLEEEIRAREAQQPSEHAGVRKEQEVELERLRSLLSNRWHPTAANHVGSTGAVDGYAEIFVFPCCKTMVRDFLSTGEDPPYQFRSDGCEQIPVRLQHVHRRRSNPFRPLIHFVKRDADTRTFLPMMRR